MATGLGRGGALADMFQTGFIVRVAEAERRVRELRERFHPVAKLGVPAHVTVLFPFMPPEDIDESVLAKAASAVREVVAFDFSLLAVRRFPATAYLAPEPPDLFVALTRSLARAFPAFPPFAGEFEVVVPHLTVAHGIAEEAKVAEFELSLDMSLYGPINARCVEVELLENSSGVWKLMHIFPLSA